MKRRSFLRQATLAGAAFTSYNGLLAQKSVSGIQNNPESDNSYFGENPIRVAVVQQDGNSDDVYPGKVAQIRKNNPWYQGLRPELYHY